MALSVLLVGPNGVGKSHLIATSPGPVLVADIEAKGSGLPRQRDHVIWHKEELQIGKFPEGLTSKSIVRYVPSDVPDYIKLLESLLHPSSPFVSVWTDSATILSQMGEVEIAKKSKDGRAGFGDLLTLLRPLLHKVLVYAESDRTRLELVGATAWQRDDKAAPSTQGSLGNWLVGMYDVVGYVSLGVINGALGQRMLIWPTDGGKDPRAKGRGWMYTKYKDEIVNPNFTELVKLHKTLGKENNG